MSSNDTKLASRVFVTDESGAVQDFAAGTSKSDVPSWAVKAIQNPKAWDDYDPDAEGDDSATGAGEPKPYDKWLKADLEAEVAKRNEARDADDQIEVGGTGKVADLAAALDADDAAGA